MASWGAEEDSNILKIVKGFGGEIADGENRRDKGKKSLKYYLPMPR